MVWGRSTLNVGFGGENGMGPVDFGWQFWLWKWYGSGISNIEWRFWW